jgi:hypothetical protein
VLNADLALEGGNRFDKVSADICCKRIFHQLASFLQQTVSFALAAADGGLACFKL